MTTQRAPGVEVGRTVTPREVLQHAARGLAVQYPVTIDGSEAYDGSNTSYERYIRGGWLLGKITSTGLFVPLRRTKTNGAGSAATELIVDNAAAFKAGDSIVIGANEAVTVSSIVYSTHTITIGSAKTWGDNEPVYVNDGSGTARAILLDDEVNCWNIEKTAQVDPSAQGLVAGFVRKSMILGDLAAALEDSQSKLRHIVLDDEHFSTYTPPTRDNLGWKQVTVAADKTLVAADSGTEFIATAAVNLTLPAIASAGQGFRIRAHQTADANLTITAPSGKLIALHNAAATSVAYSTSNQKIGAGVEIIFLPDLSKYKACNISAGVQAVTVA